MNIHIGNVALPISDFSVARTGVLGITRSGKTYAAKGIAEQLMEAGVPIIVFDAIGVWRFLKTPGDGAHAKGFPIVVAGGEEPDLPLSPHSAAEIVRAAMRENVSLVIDLYDAKLSKADWRRIVQTCFRTLLYENKSVRHIFLEEAAEYAPQKIMDGETYAEVEKLVRMGGNKGLGITLINQRAQELNKAVLELCDNLLLLRQRGSHAIDSLEKWLDRTSPDVASEIAQSLPHMTQGDVWVWTEASEKPVRTKTVQIKSFHPDRRTTGAVETARKPVDAGKFVARMSGELSKVIEEAKANDPAELKRQVAALKKQLEAKAPVASPAPKPEVKIVEKPALKESEIKRIEAAVEKLHEAGKRAFEAVDNATKSIASLLQRAVAETNRAQQNNPPARGVVPYRAPQQPREPVSRPTAGSDSDLPKGERIVLTAIAQYSDGAERDQITVLTGYKRATRNAYIQRLQERGFVTVEGRIFATPEGVAALGDSFEPLPTGATLRAYWLAKLPEGERNILKVLLDANGAPVDREIISESTGYKRATRNAYLQRLASRRLVEPAGSGMVRAAGQLFEES
jgi:hypothetical protein